MAMAEDGLLLGVRALVCLCALALRLPFRAQPEHHA